MGLSEFEKRGILGCGEDYFEKALSAPAYFVDLNLDQIIACIADERRDYDLRRYFNRLPDGATAQERVKVLRALEDETLLEGLLRFSDGMLAARQYAACYRKAEFGLQRQRFLLDCGEAYTGAVKELARALGLGENGAQEGSAFSSEGGLLSGLCGALADYMARPVYRELAERTAELSQAFAGLRVRMAIVRDKVKITQEEPEDNYAEKLKRLFPDQSGRTEQLDNPFRTEKEPGKFERLVLETFR
ncbi:MAG: hypothetical protein K2N94_13020, partial [Lachnospiraceae bacterium]|nr:hypothetical protein [Lachnospiraceae bacterium]